MLATVTAVRPFDHAKGQKRIDDLAGDLRQIVPLGDVRHQDHEASPPSRATVSIARRRFFMRCAASFEQGIPCCMAEGVVHFRNGRGRGTRTPTRPPSRSERSASCSRRSISSERFGSPVSTS